MNNLMYDDDWMLVR